jgi:FkbM family methyltransferase
MSPGLYARLAWYYKRWRGVLALRVAEACVRPGDVAVDVGANWGLYTHRLAGLVGAAGHVHAIEPDPAMAASLLAIRGGRRHVTVHPMAVSDRAGEATLHVPLVDGRRVSALGSLAVARGRAGLDHERVRVRVERLDALLEAGGRDPAFIKCDAEGQEAAVLRGAEGTLRRGRPAVLCAAEARHLDADPRSAFDSILALDYRGYALYPDGLRPLEAFDVGRDQLAFLQAGFRTDAMPPGYVQHFLLVPSGRDVSALLAPTEARR